MADEKPLADHTVAELDELAAANEVEDYPSSANKAEKVAFLEAAGVSGQPLPRYRVRLKESWFADGVEPVASFMVSEPPRPNRAVTLTAEEPTFETTDRAVWQGLLGLPWLENEGEV